MKCQKCDKSAIVHLTEVISDPEGMKHNVEVHLCLEHAVQGGLVAPGTVIMPQAGNVESPQHLTLKKKPQGQPPVEQVPPTAIVPSEPPKGLTVARKAGGHSTGSDPHTCPVCGMTWQQFKQHGIVGCAYDYTHFESKLTPIIKRTQESATSHNGKLPTKIRKTDSAIAATAARLRRELQQAVESENYERAAQLRDQLNSLGVSNA